MKKCLEDSRKSKLFDDSNFDYHSGNIMTKKLFCFTNSLLQGTIFNKKVLLFQRDTDIIAKLDINSEVNGVLKLAVVYTDSIVIIEEYPIKKGFNTFDVLEGYGLNTLYIKNAQIILDISEINSGLIDVKVYNIIIIDTNARKKLYLYKYIGQCRNNTDFILPLSHGKTLNLTNDPSVIKNCYIT